MIAVCENDGAVVLEVQGDFSEPAMDEFNRVMTPILDRRKVQVVLSLRRASWISLKALKWLVGNLKKIRARDGDMKLAGLNPYWTSLLELTGTHHLFDVYPSVEDAIASYHPLTTAVR